MKTNEEIKQISGIDSNPFKRYAGKINLNEFIGVLKQERIDAEAKGYSDLELLIQKDGGMIDITLYGTRDMTEEENENNGIMELLFRMKEKTSRGLTRDDLLKEQL